MTEEKKGLPGALDRSRSGELWADVGLNLIPYVGGALSAYLTNQRDMRFRERIASYVRYFQDELGRLDEGKIDRDFVESEEFGELFARGAEEAARTASEERIRRFANVVINNALAEPEARSRAAGLLRMVDRLSDVDAFLLLCFGDPEEPSLRAESRAEALDLIDQLAKLTGTELPPQEALVDSIIYMDNLGVTWVTQREMPRWAGGDEPPVREFSVFRPPLGDAVAGAIAPADFFIPPNQRPEEAEWPDDYVAQRYQAG
jgi:hypothetical protein